MASIQNARLLPAEVPGLRERLKMKLTTVYQEADRYGVGVETIRRCARGETFRFVREGLPETEPLPADDPVGPKYGRRATDAVHESDAVESLRKVIDGQAGIDPTVVGTGAVEDFIKRRSTDAPDLSDIEKRILEHGDAPSADTPTGRKGLPIHPLDDKGENHDDK